MRESDFVALRTLTTAPARIPEWERSSRLLTQPSDESECFDRHKFDYSIDYVVTRDNAIGKCDLTLLSALCHEHEFTVFAVDSDHIDATPDTSAAVVGFNLHFHTLAKGKLTGLYGRK